jgi:hypothetical protein
MSHHAVDVVFEVVGQIQHGLAPLCHRALFLKLLFRLKGFGADRIVLEDLDGAGHLADLVGEGAALDLDAPVACGQTGHGAGHVLDGGHDAACDQPGQGHAQDERQCTERHASLDRRVDAVQRFLLGLFQGGGPDPDRLLRQAVELRRQFGHRNEGEAVHFQRRARHLGKGSEIDFRKFLRFLDGGLPPRLLQPRGEPFRRRLECLDPLGHRFHQGRVGSAQELGGAQPGIHEMLLRHAGETGKFQFAFGGGTGDQVGQVGNQLVARRPQLLFDQRFPSASSPLHLGEAIAIFPD